MQTRCDRPAAQWVSDAPAPIIPLHGGVLLRRVVGRPVPHLVDRSDRHHAEADGASIVAQQKLPGARERPARRGAAIRRIDAVIADAIPALCPVPAVALVPHVLRALVAQPIARCGRVVEHQKVDQRGALPELTAWTDRGQAARADRHTHADIARLHIGCARRAIGICKLLQCRRSCGRASAPIPAPGGLVAWKP